MTNNVEMTDVAEKDDFANNFNKTNEDFVWFAKKAVSDKKSDAYNELFQTLLKMFVDADTNKDGLVSRGSFSKLIDHAAKIPRLYGYAPDDGDLYRNEEEKTAARTRMFYAMDRKHSGVVTFDEWLEFCLQHIAAKVSVLDPHPILDSGDKTEFLAFMRKAVVVGNPEHTELYWFLLELFLEHDKNKDGNVTMGRFSDMVDKTFELPMKLGLFPKDMIEFGGDDEKKTKAREATFKEFNTRGDGNMTFDEWLAYALEHVIKKMEGL